MKPDSFSLSAVTVTWDSAGTVSDCLSSVLREKADAKLIIADNASEDDTVETVRTKFSGACVMVWAEVFSRDGIWFNERFSLYFEDCDWYMRAREKGWKSCRVPEARKLHRWCESCSEYECSK